MTALIVPPRAAPLIARPLGIGTRSLGVIAYRRFRNTDPPGLVDVWNAATSGRGAYPLRTPSALERWLFSKPYFDANGLFLAEQDDPKKPVGFALAGFGPNAELTAIDPKIGVVCCVVVHPDHRRQGIGHELTRRAEEYLRAKGATDIRFGSMPPNNPFMLGLYGGANTPGILDSEPVAGPFLKAVGYAPADRRQVFQKSLDAPLVVADPRFGMLRRRYEAQFILRGAAAGSWWQECVWGGTLEPSELRVMDKLTNLPAARAIVWELEGFSWRWGCPSAGIFDVQVRPDLRRQGLAKLVLLDILRFLQEQFFGIAELHIPEGDPAGLGLCRTLGFEPVDAGATWRKG